MDSQHRHELQENALAHWLERSIESAKPRLPIIVSVIVAVGVAWWAFGSLRSSTASANVATWDGYAVAMERGQPNPVLLERVAEDNAGTPSAEWASITLADMQLYSAVQNYLTNRPSAEDSLAKAKERYQQLRGSRDAKLRGRAVFGLARSAEIEGDLSEATKLYNQVTGSFAEVATKRAEELTTDRVKGDYAWLATAAPAVRRPSAGLPAVPDFSVDPIATPDEETAATEPEQTGEEAIDDILKSVEEEQDAEESADGEESEELGGPLDSEADSETSSEQPAEDAAAADEE